MRIKIRDDGIGIAAETLPTIFDLFSQAEVPLARSRGGLGIGLTRPASHASNEERRRILVVEDNPDVRATLKTLLESWGHEVEVAPTGARASMPLAQFSRMSP